ncbi:acyl-CoA reductase-like NAD-dependent aldehyde dehydrogenase [Rhizobium petrolearium]|jgi:acyl-CoA reductase-like NAD-dependent aldehyde dehydrogenase|uniref:Aldehyde dehydrogenase n=2 Tax=Neorhizobium TaxID=1525371 RepID=A0ABV0MA58_9HYPH|nr:MULTISPECIES: aldehyde dehydrogenase [Hyphomicrobiales]MAM12053.1 dehydrogenase [Rhizobiaceae bacterium]AMM86043.1 dehydrogenase [Martelella sp. AD-3]MBP1847285.1 acyl-CoA reductase-like NAD-dependent aldehyde dehydrogenase [Neorhizobium petrolearium]MCC2614325.1 aldehyde dehydrogenase [Neorhizobium petrolearium]WGI72426.1 aldehyde dehydrogenase [Neorhizobium petrolearium]
MTIQLYIDNEPRNATGNVTFERRSPVSGEVVTQGAAANPQDAVAAIESAERAFASWSQTGPGQRRVLLMKAAEEIERRTEEFVLAMKAEVGAGDLWARFNVMLAANVFREAAAMTTQIQGNTIPSDKPGTLSMTVRQPVGVILSIVPWNGPIVLAARAIAYPLMCGNTVVFRASETSPKTHVLVAEAVHAAGFPPGTLNFVINDPKDAPEVVEAMIAHPAVRRVNFTGSTHVGRIIATACGRHLKRSLMELGDKSPMVVLADADIDGAVNATIFGAFLYQGQICMTTERAIVDESVADAFVEKLAARAAQLEAGDPRSQAACALGPIISQGAVDRLNGLLADAVAKGAKIRSGGHADTTLMAPTVLDGVTPEMRIYSEEAFGPILQVIRVCGAEEAVRVANDTEYGLSAAVFGTDMARALDVAMRIQTGAVHINGSTVSNEAQAPYGGTKASGWGRFDSIAVIDEFTELKWITIEQPSQPYPL